MTPEHATIEAIRQIAQIPTERRLWSIATIAEYAELSPSHVMQKIACLPDFPKAILALKTGRKWTKVESREKCRESPSRHHFLE